jgi:hypothetical protein
MPGEHAKNLLLTGLPNCGKTTAIRRLIERLADLRLAGFYTQELREGGQRVAFEAVGLSTRQHVLLAHVRSRWRRQRPCRVRPRHPADVAERRHPGGWSEARVRLVRDRRPPGWRLLNRG